jgi:V/A-type H+-transporting ATPase subunit I
VRHADVARFRSEVAAAGGVRLAGGEDERHRYKVVLFHREDEKAVREALARSGFQAVELPAIAATVAERQAQLGAEQRALREAARAEEARIEGLAARHADLLALRDLLTGRLERLRAGRLLGETRDAVSIEGWVPTQLLEATRAAIVGRFSLASFEVYDPSPADRVPVLLSNAPLARPFEAVVELYGLPRYGGIDPTSVLGFFFALFFGVCLTDAGYGILLALAAGVAMAYTPAATFPERRRLLALFLLGGLATIAVGAAAGGWFGVTVRWKLFDPLQQIMLFFALAALLGTAHLFAGLTLRIVHQVRRGEVLAPLLDQGLWMTLIAPLIGLLGVAAGVIPASLEPGLAFVALASALGIVFFHGRGEAQLPREPLREALHHLAWGGLALSLSLHLLGQARPWSGFAAAALGLAVAALLRGRILGALGRVGLGLYSLYGISGYLSDILSYSRLVALGLGSGTVAMVVNTMASQALGMPVVGFVAAALIFVVGHLFNLAINLLGAFVHSCRLQYVEFFTKFYESGGRPYTPFRMAPKHVTIVEVVGGA